MSWIEITIPAPAAEVERTSDALEAAGASAVTVRDAADQPIYEPGPGETPLWAEAQVVGLFPGEVDPAGIRAALTLSLGSIPEGTAANEVADQEWTRAWMDDFQPMRFGRRLWICPSWADAPDPEAVNLRLDPGLAFGSGTHATTALCLEWLDAHPPEGRTVLDYGAGSGVLAVAAALLGATDILAVDNDPQAVTATPENARNNGVADRIRSHGIEDDPGGTADLVLANILAGTLQELAPYLASRTAPGGDLVLSGILEEQAEAVAASYAPWFEMDPPVEQDGWIRLDGRRRMG
ncbi:ribosomal protein L11 methyltransferase [Thiohalospira halophila DSM 15071]|uniref:Ribosomal protein L11 methyltransferase n=1 Tax=Thiohalospira halophila DSM 15071 TaxID=1123397 RepID=A0A1I1PWL3_9GAMM|nr:50S ribosomal protein L11 methyltransferase [Thiohalospira halophila]SFD14097.1 ribosomal protein L11 methyltransferase [Thiohalospira halophila DSM 15071]